MEVTTVDDAQAVLLESMEGTQYITIQRADGENLGKGVPILTLNGEIISEGMVVDMINAGVASEYTNATQYYATEDLLPHELTEEDKKLAAALVAVQLQQHQKQQQHQQQQLQQQQQQQLHRQSQHEDSPLPDVSHLAPLSPDNAYSIQTIAEPEPSAAYSTIQTYKRSQNVKQEFINVKSEYAIEVSAESSEDAATPSSGPKRSLPHKKRIPKKLKQQTKRNSSKRDTAKNLQPILTLDSNGHVEPRGFTCELCDNRFDGQLKFFEHLKTHYEPVKKETRIAQATNTNITMSVPAPSQSLENTGIDEFSEPEDLMEGIRGVVEETGAHIDEESETPLSGVNGGPTLWSIAEMDEARKEQNRGLSTINEQDLQDKYDAKIPKTTKKKNPPKFRRVKDDDYPCPRCERTFNHKNSLVYHMRSHSGERPHQCEVCGKSFFAASALKVHKRLHSGDKPYKCEDCGRHFRQWGDLKYHSMSIHSEQRPFQCEYCGKDFARKYSLIVHRRIHTGEKNYRCEYCNKTFRASSYLQNHRRIHTGEKPHPCDVCGKPFRVRSDMKRHMLTHSRGNANAERPAVEGATTEKNVVSEDSDEKGCRAKTIQDLVQELKLEVEPNGVVEIVSTEDNPESILPHEGGQTLEYGVTSNTDASNDRDPLEAVDRNSDTLQYFFI